MSFSALADRFEPPLERRKSLLGFGLLFLVAFVLLVPTGALGTTGGPSSGNPSLVGASATLTTPAPDALAACGSPCHVAAGSSSILSAKIVLSALDGAKAVPWSFWGINVAAAAPFTNTDAAAIAATPVTFVRFPGGFLGEELNYTSNVLTAINGSQTPAATNVSQFVSTCRMFSCQAILQMPAEIDSPSTAAYYANYVVNTLHFQPAFWEIGNSPSGWVHFDVPWGQWATRGGGNTTPVPFANEVAQYIKAISAVDPAGRFLALGMTMWVQGNGIFYDKSWITALASIDGTKLAGITVHSYINNAGPSKPTWSDLFANLKGEYSLPDQIDADRSYILSACPSCTHLYMYVSEINAAQLSTYDNLLTTFAGPLYEAAEATQGLNLHVSNLDWFCYDCHFQGAWEQGPGNWQKQYTLFRDVLSRLENQTVPITQHGPWWLYAAATYNTSGLGLMLVNVNGNHAVNVTLGGSQLVRGALGTEYLWQRGQSAPVKSSFTIAPSIEVPVHSILLLSVGPSGLRLGGTVAGPAGSAPAVHSAPGSSGIPLRGAAGGQELWTSAPASVLPTPMLADSRRFPLLG